MLRTRRKWPVSSVVRFVCHIGSQSEHAFAVVLSFPSPVQDPLIYSLSQQPGISRCLLSFWPVLLSECSSLICYANLSVPSVCSAEMGAACEVAGDAGLEPLGDRMDIGKFKHVYPAVVRPTCSEASI